MNNWKYADRPTIVRGPTVSEYQKYELRERQFGCNEGA